MRFFNLNLPNIQRQFVRLVMEFTYNTYNKFGDVYD